MKRISLIVLLVLTTSLHAQSIHNEFKLAHPQLDGWTLGHMAKGALTYTAARLLTAEKKYALATVFLCAVTYEIVHDGWGLTKYADSRGADLVGDVVADCLGGVIAYTLETLFKLDNRLDNINIGLTGNEVKICINF